MTYKQGTYVRTVYGDGKVVTEATDMHGYTIEYPGGAWLPLVRKKKVYGEVFGGGTVAFNISEDDIRVWFSGRVGSRLI